MPARPNRDGHAGGRKRNTDPTPAITSRNEAYPQPPVVRAGPKQIKREQKRQHVTKPLPPRLAPFRLLQLERGNDPVQTENKPQRVNPLPLRREIHESTLEVAGLCQTGNHCAPVSPRFVSAPHLG